MLGDRRSFTLSIFGDIRMDAGRRNSRLLYACQGICSLTFLTFCNWSLLCCLDTFLLTTIMWYQTPGIRHRKIDDVDILRNRVWRTNGYSFIECIDSRNNRYTWIWNRPIVRILPLFILVDENIVDIIMSRTLSFNQRTYFFF